jgi:hypothetical protein
METTAQAITIATYLGLMMAIIALIKHFLKAK